VLHLRVLDLGIIRWTSRNTKNFEFKFDQNPSPKCRVSVEVFLSVTTNGYNHCLLRIHVLLGERTACPNRMYW
jgi:hypothetical protein